MKTLSRRASLGVAALLSAAGPPAPLLAALPPFLPEGSRGALLLEASLRPKPRALPRRRINLDFAVLLMRSSYAVADELDFVPMDEFQRSQFLFRQGEWDEYRKVLPVQQGDLSDPAYFDFISFVQHATMAQSMRTGRLVFEEAQNAEGDTVVVNRRANASLPQSNKDLPAAHASRVGVRLLEWMDATFPTLAPRVPREPTAAALLDGVGKIAAILEIEDYALSVRAAPLPSGLELALVAPANLWSGQVLRLRGDEPANDFECKAVVQYLARCGVPATYETRLQKGGTEVVHSFRWPEYLAL